jgi:hypothetical protein
MASAVILEDTDSVFNSLKGKIYRMAKNLGTEVSVYHRKSRIDFDKMLDELEKAATSAMLVICDIENQQGETVQELHKRMKEIWQQPGDTWMGGRPIVVYTRNDETYNHMKRVARHPQRNASAVILQTPATGRDPLEELRNALTDAINAL